MRAYPVTRTSKTNYYNNSKENTEAKNIITTYLNIARIPPFNYKEDEH